MLPRSAPAPSPARPAAPPSTDARPAPTTTPVLYLTGFGRSGSTVIGRILGELPRTAYLGELNFFWSDGVLGDRPCGCGAPLRECPQWSQVLDAFGPGLADTARQVMDGLAQTTRMRHGLTSLSAAGARRVDGRLAGVVDHLDELYRVVARVFDVDLVVDSSKSPMYRRALELASGVEVQAIHLVRDPRACAASWRVPKREAIGGLELPTFGVARSALEWSVSNLLAARAGAGQPQLRYEDFMARPDRELARLGGLLRRDFTGVTIEGGSASLGVSHSIAGNPDRFLAGPVELAADERWRTSLTRRERAVVTGLTLPLLRRLGYPLRRPALPQPVRTGAAQG